jgi:hypothetical protein
MVGQVRARLGSTFTAVGLLSVIIAGCATDDGPGGVMPDDTPTPSAPAPSSSDGPPMSSTDLPTLRPPSGPPRTPSDQVPVGWLTGTVTAGGTGPCYGLETDDGAQYAVYGDQGWTLRRGERVRVRVEPLRLKIYCGPGTHVSMLELRRPG